MKIACFICLAAQCVAENDTLWDVFAGTNSTMEAAVVAADLVGTLSSPGPLTLMAPTDEAFAALPDGMLDYLLKPNNKAQLVDILMQHILPKRFVSHDIEVDGGIFVQTLNNVGMKVFPKSSSRSPCGQLDNSSSCQYCAMSNVNTFGAVFFCDVPVANGILNFVDAVLLPPAMQRFTIRLYQTTDKCLDALGNQSAGSKVGLVDCTHGDHPVWIYNDIKEFIQYADSDLCISAIDYGHTDVFLQPCSLSGSWADWQWNKKDKSISDGETMCIGITDPALDGTEVKYIECEDGWNQWWQLDSTLGPPPTPAPTPAPAAVVSVRMVYQPGKCLDVVGNQSVTSGSIVGLKHCSEGTNPVWMYEKVLGHLQYAFNSSLCIDAGDLTSQNTLTLQPCASFEWQSWLYAEDRSAVSLLGSADLCLGIDRMASDGLGVKTLPCNNDNGHGKGHGFWSQMWEVGELQPAPAPSPIPTPPRDTYSIAFRMPKRGPDSLCMDVVNPGQVGVGSPLVLVNCSEGVHPVWIYDRRPSIVEETRHVGPIGWIQYASDPSLCVDAGSFTDSNALTLQSCHLIQTQSWGYERLDYRQIFMDGPFCFGVNATCDSYGCDATSGAPVSTMVCEPYQKNQKWSMYEANVRMLV